MSEPYLSVIATAGPRRPRVQRMVAAVAAQTAVDRLELILIDVAPDGAPIQEPAELPVAVVPYRGSSLGEARVQALPAARGEAIAFVADHVYPDPGWADALIAAYRDGDWAAAGYSFRRANRDTYGGRAAFLADFAQWLAPADTAEVEALPPNDVSFRRSTLDSLGGELQDLLTAEPLLFQELRARGERMAVIGDALVAHGALRSVRGNALASFDFCQALAGIQRRRGHWGIARRLAQAVASALLAPAIRVVQGVRHLRPKVPLRVLLVNLPGMVIQHQAAGVGQSWGYLVGTGDAARRFLGWEIYPARDDR